MLTGEWVKIMTTAVTPPTFNAAFIHQLCICGGEEVHETKEWKYCKQSTYSFIISNMMIPIHKQINLSQQNKKRKKYG